MFAHSLSTSPPWRVRASLLLAFAVGLTVAATPVPVRSHIPGTQAVEQSATPAAPAAERVLHAHNGGPLPFHSDAEILLALKDGEITHEETLGEGTTGVRRLEINYEGRVVRAVFRDVDTYERNLRLRDGSAFAGFYDRFASECAAYELDRMLGMNMIPPAALRRVHGEPGSVQLWVEDSMTEGDRATQGLRPPDSTSWRRQQAIMRVFDALIANSDRNTGNSLIDADWNLWLIDHSRTFQIPRGDSSFAAVNQIPAGLWEALQQLDQDAVRERLRDYLEPAQFRALFKRHDQLVAHIQELIDTRGAGAVIIP